MKTDFSWEFVKRNIIGNYAEVHTPFGKRVITYADYTASGRGLYFIEDYIKKNLELYANTHTEDDATGKITSDRLRQAESTIKRLVHADDHYKIIETGTGTTGAIHRLQQILGVYIPPVAKAYFSGLFRDYFDEEEQQRFESYLLKRRPVVFIGPFEHHSNVVSWRECFAEVVEIELGKDGLLDTADLERKLENEKYEKRLKIGSFSAASNVTGIRAPVFEIARMLHRKGAYAFFDYAAIAPYEPIDIMKDEEGYFDGIFFSPHKFLGGPGSSGILIIHEKIYDRKLPPTTGGGGTVDYVNLYTQDYSADIEMREKPGTPGILQIIRAALVLELKQKMNPDKIEKRENELIKRVFMKLEKFPDIEIVGNLDPEKRISILSFNIRCKNAYLHPRFVTKLLNDLFGIQSRAGCLCAGPYGHRLLHIDNRQSDKYRGLIHRGYQGLKPGWTRLNFHFLISDEECDYICDAVRFIAENGLYFLPLYDFDITTGIWEFRGSAEADLSFGLADAVTGTSEDVKEIEPAVPYETYLGEAKQKAAELEVSFSEEGIVTTDAELIPFLYYA